jgi:predicted PurR-regulated permease PerM
MKNVEKPASRDLIETILLVLLFIGLIYALYMVLQVFFGVLTFALIFSVSFAATYEKLVKLLKGRRKLSSVIYSFTLISLVAVPLIFLIAAMSRHLKQLIPWFAFIKVHGLPPLPNYLTELPLVGNNITSFWTTFRESPKEMIGTHEHQLNTILMHILTGGLGILGVAVQFIIGIIISAFLLERGDNLLTPITNSIRQLFSEQDGNDLLKAISQAIKGVSIGVMGTGFVVAFVCWTGLIITGIPFATGIAALIFFLVVIQIGALVIWIPLIVLEIIRGNQATAVILSVYLAIIIGIELVVKPVLIAKSGKLPFLVLFLGVVGGLAAWGFTGMFKGAIITSIFYTVYTKWLERRGLTAQKEDPL